MKQDLYELPEGWGWKDLLDVASTSGFKVGKIPKKDFLEKGTLPIIDQSQNYIAGYCESDDGFEGKLPVIVFGDHTNSVKHVDFQFICGADGTKVLAPMKGVFSWFLYYAIMQFRPESQGYRRHFPILKKQKIPLPPLNEQKRIVAKLDALFTRIDTAITHLQQTLELTKALFASELDEVFSPEKNKGRPISLNQVATVARGKSKHRPRNDKTLFGGNYPFIQTGDVRNAEKYVTTYSTTYNEIGLAQSKLWSKGTICLTIAANIGDVAILGIDACFPDSVVGISSDRESNDYIYYFLTTLQRHLDSKATMAAQKNINLRVLSEIEIPLPELDEQKRIVAHLDALSEYTRTLEAATQEKLNDLTTLKASLLDATFKGQLMQPLNESA